MMQSGVWFHPRFVESTSGCIVKAHADFPTITLSDWLSKA